MTQAGYYDYTPTVTLLRPVALIGHPGCAYREVAYDLAALTGLTLHDFDHRVEHDVGQTLWSFARQNGRDELYRLEEALLPGLLTQSPPGIIVLGEGALHRPEQLTRVQAQATLLFFHLPRTTCYWALRRRQEERGGVLMHPWLPDRLDGPQDLQPFLEGMRPAAAAADRVVDMEGQGVHEVVLELQQWLPALDKRRKMEKTGC
jgi:shikimate kinase